MLGEAQFEIPDPGPGPITNGMQAPVADRNLIASGPVVAADRSLQSI